MNPDARLIPIEVASVLVFVVLLCLVFLFLLGPGERQQEEPVARVAGARHRSVLRIRRRRSASTLRVSSEAAHSPHRRADMGCSVVVCCCFAFLCCLCFCCCFSGACC